MPFLISKSSASTQVFSDYSWPNPISGMSHCDFSELNDCLATMDDGINLYINTNTPIDESISLSHKSISLIAATGYSPIFT